MTAQMSINGFMSSPLQVSKWAGEARERVRQGVAREMRSAQAELKGAATNTVAAAFRVSRSSFPKAWSTRVYAEKRNKMPAVLVQNKIKWMGIQEAGGTIRTKKGGMLIPFGGLRIGFKAWQKLIRGLRDSKQSFFRQIGNRVILFARSAPGQRGRAFAAFRGMTAAGVPRMGKVKRGQAFPVATLVSAVRLRGRYSLENAVRPVVARIARSIESKVSVA